MIDSFLSIFAVIFTLFLILSISFANSAKAKSFDDAKDGDGIKNNGKYYYFFQKPIAKEGENGI